MGAPTGFLLRSTRIISGMRRRRLLRLELHDQGPSRPVSKSDLPAFLEFLDRTGTARQRTRTTVRAITILGGTPRRRRRCFGRATGCRLIANTHVRRYGKAHSGNPRNPTRPPILPSLLNAESNSSTQLKATPPRRARSVFSVWILKNDVK
jgi:hypothetical protein